MSAFVPAGLQALRDRASERRTQLRTLWATLPAKGRQKAAATALQVDVATIRRDLSVLKAEGWAP